MHTHATKDCRKWHPGRTSRCALDMNVIFTLDNIVLVPIVSRLLAKDCGGKQYKDLLFMSAV